MSRHSNAVRLLGGAALVAVAACSDSTSPPSKEPVPVVQAAQSPDLATLARAVPTGYSTVASRRGKVGRALAGFALGRGFAPSKIKGLAGRNAYGDLTA